MALRKKHTLARLARTLWIQLMPERLGLKGMAAQEEGEAGAGASSLLDPMDRVGMAGFLIAFDVATKHMPYNRL